MTGRTPMRGATDSTTARRGKMSARWNRAFATLLLLSLTTAVLSVVVVQKVESTFAAATDEVTRETAAFDQITGGGMEQIAAGHAVLDDGSTRDRPIPRRGCGG